MDLFGLIRNPNPFKVKTGTRPHAAHKVPLLTATASRVIGVGAGDQAQDGLAHEVPSVETATTTEVVQEPVLEKEVAAIGPRMNKRRRQRGIDEEEANASPKVLRKDNATPHLAQSTRGGKSLAAMGLETGFTFTPVAQETFAAAKSVSDPDLLSYARPPPHSKQDVAQSSKGTATEILPQYVATTEVNVQLSVGSPDSGKSTSVLSVDGRLVSNLQAQVTGEERIKSAFEEFKKYEDDKVEQRCAEIDARLDALSIDFDEELYPHMLTAIVGHRWVIGHGLRLVIMKCAESTELRQVFADVVSAGIVKGINEGLRHGVEHKEAKLDLAAIEAYDPKADAKYVAALYRLDYGIPTFGG
ncbi:hypothetical protein Tco_0618298 [Tanacetum coccineum]